MKLIPKIILIGCGPHAKRVYIPALELLVKSRKVELKLVVDLIENEENIKSFLKEYHNPYQVHLQINLIIFAKKIILME